jgi:hypothetical protein
MPFAAQIGATGLAAAGNQQSKENKNATQTGS